MSLKNQPMQHSAFNPSNPFSSEDLRPLADKKGIQGRISSYWNGKRVDVYLARCFPFLSRSSWQKRCFLKKILVNDHPIRPSYRLKEGQQVCHHYPRSSEPPVNDTITCFYHHHHLRAFYKPPHLPMHEGGRYRKHTFSEIITQRWGTEWRAVHRLDKDTSGIILCGNTSEVRAQLSQAFRSHSTQKTYYAIACGKPLQKSWCVTAPLGYSNQTTWRTKRWVQKQGGKPAITHFQVLKQASKHCLLKITPVHGRTHQIRIHAAYAGFPLVGDTRYFADESIFLHFLKEGYSQKVLSHIMAPRLCLHAAKLTIAFKMPHQNHPKTIHLESPLPEDMSWIFEQLSKDPHTPLSFDSNYPNTLSNTPCQTSMVRREGLEPSRSKTSTRPST